MPQFERRLYEPSDDMRAFDAGEDDLDDEGSRLPLLIVIALVVLASFAGVVWLAYTQGVQRGRESAPRIIAEQPAAKTAPEKNPYAGLNIYKPSKPNGEQIEQDTVPPTRGVVAPKSAPASQAMQGAEPSIKPAAPPPVPISKSAVAQPTAIPQNTTASAPAATAKPIATSTKPASGPMVSKTSPTKTTIVPQRTPAAKQTAARSAPVAAGSPTPARVATAAPRIIAPPATLKPAAKRELPPAKFATAGSLPNTKTTLPPTATTPETNAASSQASPLPAQKSATAAPQQRTEEHAGGFLLQIGSYKSEAEATASWQTYKSAHPVVAAYASDIHRAELGAKGTWYRLRVGPFASLTEANAACSKIKARGGNCFPAKR